jgi:uracil-DNA glycosylase
MEPYPTSFVRNEEEIPMATGRSFEVSILEGEDWNYKIKQSSLRNILKTIYYNETNNIIPLEDIRKKINDKSFEILNPTDLFNNLESQGVLFLNATLTVEKENVDSHRKYWEYFMNELVKYIISKNKDVKWLLWGDKAKQRILPLIDETNAVISQHPRLAGFVNENCFGKIKNINWIGTEKGEKND